MSQQQSHENSQKLPNSERRIAKRFWLLCLVFGAVTGGVFIDNTPLSGFWALGLVGIFLTISAIICGCIFTSRAQKMDHLISGVKVLAAWSMDEQMARDYVMLQKSESSAKNNAIMLLVTILFVVITIPFLFFLESDERLGFVTIMAGVLAFVFVASRFFPWYYRMRNLQGDRRVLIGAKYAYINGYLHNWDFPLSGLQEVQTITTPFTGLNLIYYTTDRTFKHNHELKIPAPEDVDLRQLITKLRAAN